MAALRLLFVAALLALPFWAAHSTPAHACTCGAALVSRADLIVVGTVGEMLVLPPESVEHPETLAGGRIPTETKFSVSEYIKGSGPSVVLIYQAQPPPTGPATSCDTFFDAGDQYVLVLDKSDSLRYSTGVCSGNLKIPEGQDPSSYIAQIRAAVAAERVGLPPTGSGTTHHGGPPIALLAAASALAGVALVANGWFVLRRRD